MDSLLAAEDAAANLQGTKYVPRWGQGQRAGPIRTTRLDIILESGIYVPRVGHGVRATPTRDNARLFERFLLDYALDPLVWASAVEEVTGVPPTYVEFGNVGSVEIGSKRGRVHLHFQVTVGHQVYHNPSLGDDLVDGPMTHTGTFQSGVNAYEVMRAVRQSQWRWATANGNHPAWDDRKWVLAGKIVSDGGANYNAKVAISRHYAWLFQTGGLRHVSRTAQSILAEYAQRGISPTQPRVQTLGGGVRLIG